MNNNFFSDILSMIQNGGNPQQLVLNMLQAQARNDPRLEVLVGLARNNDARGIENFARQYVKSQGGDFDKEFKAFRKNFRL